MRTLILFLYFLAVLVKSIEVIIFSHTVYFTDSPFFPEVSWQLPTMARSQHFYYENPSKNIHSSPSQEVIKLLNYKLRRALEKSMETVIDKLGLQLWLHVLCKSVSQGKLCVIHQLGTKYRSSSKYVYARWNLKKHLSKSHRLCGCISCNALSDAQNEIRALQ